jgi:CheY-like chemotaxis protein
VFDKDLKQAGYDTQQATSGEEALEILIERPPNEVFVVDNKNFGLFHDLS